jgi:hypothetical protein
MAIDGYFFAFAAMVWLAFASEAAIGFCSVVIALTLGAQIYPLQSLVPLVVPLSLVLTGTILSRHHEHVHRTLLLRRILPWMVVGMLLGLPIAQVAPAQILESIFGAFVVVVAARELRGLLRKGAGSQSPLPTPAQHAGMLGAGVIHGVFASGGPLLVYVISRAGLGKSNLRSTLASVWFVLNGSLTLLFVINGRLDASALPFLGVLLPVVALAIVTGEWAHHRLDEGHFRVIVYAILMLAGVSLLV